MVIFTGCTGIPQGLEPVSDFDVTRYVGKWYEIARLDHSFERNMSNVSATYTQLDKGYIQVLNRGYNFKTGKWKQVIGKAHFIENSSIGSLKVSFFGPFYGGYHVIELDKINYSYSMVAGPNRSYLWILSRSASMDEVIYTRLVGTAKEWGFDTAKLIKVTHDKPDG
jgi:apolipoprotein D and lipocalin family protein